MAPLPGLCLTRYPHPLHEMFAMTPFNEKAESRVEPCAETVFRDFDLGILSRVPSFA